jgi:hypothetical protein
MFLENPLIKNEEEALQDNNTPVYRFGYTLSQQRLRKLRFDPIDSLIKQYQKLEWEVQYQEKMRTGEIVELNSQGKPRAYRAEVHHALYDKLIKIGSELLKYGYGKAPDENILETPPENPRLIVNLHATDTSFIERSKADD